MCQDSGQREQTWLATKIALKKKVELAWLLEG